MLVFSTYLALILAIAYAMLLIAIVISWKKRKNDTPIKDKVPPFISILIPARNEADNILNCLTAILKQNYPTDCMEVIVIDDHSNDATAKLVRSINDKRLRLLELEHFLNKNQPIQAYKKAALKLGISHAKGDFIITTDADCTAGSKWLHSFANAFQSGKKMVLAPVMVHGKNNFLDAFEGLDVAGTMLLTGASVFWNRPLLSNGANFGFSKDFFHSLGAYSGNESQASGDDVFLLQKAVQCDVNTIGFLNRQEALVQTMSCKSWASFFWQRLRWAGKTSAYKDPYLIGFQALVYLFCLLLWGLTIAVFFGFFVSKTMLSIVWLLKFTSDVFYLFFAIKKGGHNKWKRWIIPAFFVHSLYIVLIGTLALLPIKSRWKGRLS